MTEDQAVELAKALKIVVNELDKQVGKGRLQVLWKLRKYGAYSVFLPGCRIEQIFYQAFQQDRIRAIEWLQADTSFFFFFFTEIIDLFIRHLCASFNKLDVNTYKVEFNVATTSYGLYTTMETYLRI